MRRMRSLILIPARYASSRYPGKPLARLKQPDGSSKTLIEMTWEAARRVDGVDEVIVATDDKRISDDCERIGARVLMTSEDCSTGTERCFDALARGGLEADIIINFQGDAPLTPPWVVEALIATMRAEPAAHVATPVLACDEVILKGLLEDRQHGRVGGTTAVFDEDGHALYFSKEVIPCVDGARAPPDAAAIYYHVGVYAYRPLALADYVNWPVGRLERLEGLEQLRFLENGANVKCVEVDGRGRAFGEVNNPEDVPRIESILMDQDRNANR